MTDAISNAQQISGCENSNSQSLIHSLWTGKTVAQIIKQYPEYSQYVFCLTRNLVQISNDNLSEANRLGGLNNSQIMQICLPTFEQNRKVYCTNKVKNKPITQAATGSLDTPLQADPELLKATAAAKAQKILTDKEEEAVKKANIIIETLKRNAAALLTSDISNPILQQLVQTKVESALGEIEEKVQKLVKEQAAKSKKAIKDNTSLFGYPMKPIVAETTVADAGPEPPKIEPLPTI